MSSLPWFCFPLNWDSIFQSVLATPNTNSRFLLPIQGSSFLTFLSHRNSIHLTVEGKTLGSHFRWCTNSLRLPYHFFLTCTRYGWKPSSPSIWLTNCKVPTLNPGKRPILRKQQEVQFCWPVTLANLWRKCWWLDFPHGGRASHIFLLPVCSGNIASHYSQDTQDHSAKHTLVSIQKYLGHLHWRKDLSFHEVSSYMGILGNTLNRLTEHLNKLLLSKQPADYTYLWPCKRVIFLLLITILAFNRLSSPIGRYGGRIIFEFPSSIVSCFSAWAVFLT